MTKTGTTTGVGVGTLQPAGKEKANLGASRKDGVSQLRLDGQEFASDPEKFWEPQDWNVWHLTLARWKLLFPPMAKES